MRLIFGIRTTEAVSLIITAEGLLPQQPPDLRIKTSEQDVPIPCRNNTWTATLAAGDHVAYMPAAGDSWFNAPLTFTLSAQATIVGRENTSGQLLTWNATAGAADDPKNPWPPPLDVHVDAASLTDSTWLHSTLATMNPEVSTARSAPSHAPPASTREPGGFR